MDSQAITVFGHHVDLLPHLDHIPFQARSSLFSFLKASSWLCHRTFAHGISSAWNGLHPLPIPSRLLSAWNVRSQLRSHFLRELSVTPWPGQVSSYSWDRRSLAWNMFHSCNFVLRKFFLNEWTRKKGGGEGKVHKLPLWNEAICSGVVNATPSRPKLLRWLSSSTQKRLQGQGRPFLTPCVLGGPCQGVRAGSWGEDGWSRVNTGTPTSTPVFTTSCWLGRKDFLLFGSRWGWKPKRHLNSKSWKPLASFTAKGTWKSVLFKPVVDSSLCVSELWGTGEWKRDCLLTALLEFPLVPFLCTPVFHSYV